MLNHLNLAGDGDEVWAIEDVEREFSIMIDTSNAGQWSTVGHVYEALLSSLPESAAKQPDNWDRFCRALCGVGGDDPNLVRPETTLLMPRKSLIDAIRGLFVR